MKFLRSAIFNVLFFGISSLTIVLLVLTLPLPRAALKWGMRFWMVMVMGSLKHVVGLRWEVRGRENIPAGAAIIASKHQSAWETGIYFLILEDASYVLKKELMSVPIYGWLLKKSRMVAIDRDGGASALKQMVRDSRDVIASDRQLVIFPEGTRSQPGTTLPYHPGIAAVYKQANVPVVPVALNSGLFWGRRSFAKNPGCIVIEFLEPVPPGLDRKSFMAELESRIEQGSSRLLEEATKNQT